MKKFFWGGLGVGFVVLTVVFLSPFYQVSAQEPEGIRVQPAIIEDKVDPGETYTFTVKVTNVAGMEKTFYLDKQNISGLTDGGLPIFSSNQEETPYELSSWIESDQEFVVVGTNETKEVSISIKVPEDASPGSHFGGLFFDLKPERLREIGSGVGYKVGTIISLKISGDIVEEARLRGFSSGKMIYGSPNVDFNTRVENLGNVLIRPHGILEIIDIFGKKISSIRVNESGSAVFPKGEKSFDLKWDHDGFAFGRYQALLSLVYGEEGRKTIDASISFWVLPLKPILISLGVILFLIILVLVLVKRHINKRLREMSELSGVSVKGNATVGYKNQKSSSRLIVVVISLLIFVIIFLAVMFFLLA